MLRVALKTVTTKTDPDLSRTMRLVKIVGTVPDLRQRPRPIILKTLSEASILSRVVRGPRVLELVHHPKHAFAEQVIST